VQRQRHRKNIRKGLKPKSGQKRSNQPEITSAKYSLIGRIVMHKIIFSIFFGLTFLCSCSDLNNAAKKKSDEATTYYNNGIAYAKRLQYQRAIDEYNKAIRLRSDYVDAYYNRGGIYYKLGQMQRSIKDYSEAIRHKPDHADAYNNRGIIYFLQGNYEQGCRDAKKACNLGACTLLKWVQNKRYCR